MSFMYPMGLLVLLGIPVIILIYILQSKYTEQTVNSNYLWHLSEKFMKRRNPLSGITGIISLILQILMVLAIALMISKPIFVLPGAAKNYCFVLDASASMTTVDGKNTRFENAKNEIEKVINSSKDGSSYSLICVSAESVNVFNSIRSKKTAIELLEDVKPEQSTLRHEDALTAAQSVFDEDTSTLVYLVTDKSYETHENIEVINVTKSQKANYGIFDVEYSHSGGTLKVNANVISYLENAELDIKLIKDGSELASERVSAKADTQTAITIEAQCEAFDSFKVEIDNEDGYMLDNSIEVFNLKSDKTYSVLIVSETGFFFKAVIDALVDSQIDIVSPDKYEEIDEEYGLYIFDSYEPATLPDGAVWLINADESIPNSGFGVRGKVKIPLADTLQKSNSTATTVRHLLRGVSGEGLYITDYIKYSGMYLDYYTLFSYDSSPLIFAGLNGLGNRQVVFGFDVHQSDISLSTDFVILMRNLLEYSFPNVIEKANYVVGDEAIVNIVANAENYKAVSPSGKDIYIATDSAADTVLLDEVGEYTVNMTLAGKEVTYKLYSSAHPSESEPTKTEPDFSLSGVRTDANIDGTYDPTTVLFICLAVLFTADWGVYCYEKYQLR